MYYQVVAPMNVFVPVELGESSFPPVDGRALHEPWGVGSRYRCNRQIERGLIPGEEADFRRNLILCPCESKAR